MRVHCVNTAEIIIQRLTFCWHSKSFVLWQLTITLHIKWVSSARQIQTSPTTKQCAQCYTACSTVQLKQCKRETSRAQYTARYKVVNFAKFIMFPKTQYYLCPEWVWWKRIHVNCITDILADCTWVHLSLHLTLLFKIKLNKEASSKWLFHLNWL